MDYYSEKAMFERSFQRPNDFFALSPATQWAIDKSLGILDWDGCDLTREEKERFKRHYQ